MMMNTNINDSAMPFEFFKMDPVLPKPRNIRWTILSDRGLPLGFQEDLMDYFGDIIDKIKIADHAALECNAISAEIIKKKIKLYNDRGVPVFPGGMPFQIAYASNQVDAFYDRLLELGFSGVEISADSMPAMPVPERSRVIKLACSKGLDVYTEAGEKHGDELLSAKEAIDLMNRDLDDGAHKVTVENEEFAQFYKNDPQIITEIIEGVGLEQMIFEVTPKEWPGMAAHLIMEFGPNINAENLGHELIMPLEAMRRGMSRTTGFSYLAGLVNR